MPSLTVPRNSMDAARAPIDDRVARPTAQSMSAVLEGMLLADPTTAQRALATLVADELVGLETWPGTHVIELTDGTWAVDVPKIHGHGLVIIPRINGADIDAVVWEAVPRSKTGGPQFDAPALAVEPLGLRPQMVHELLNLVRCGAPSGPSER